MPGPNADPSAIANLRRDAETHIKEGSAPKSAGWSVGVNALSLLHELASKPDSAVDALKLLHELQVYQIELDMQHEQIELAHRDFVEDLRRYRDLFDGAPVAYIRLNHQHAIVDCNIQGSQLFAVGLDDMRGRFLDTLLEPASRTVFQQLLTRLRPDGTAGSCEVQLRTWGARHKMQAVASADAGGHSYLVVFVDLPAPR